MDQEFAPIDALPDEILLMIFNNISGHELNVSVSKVNQRWKHIISHIMLKIMYPGDHEKIHGGLTSLLVTSYIPSLPGPSAIIFQIATLIPNLKELTISIEYSLNDTELKIVETLHNLRHLDVFAIINSLNTNTSIPSNITSLVVNNNMAPGFLCKLKKQRVMEAFHMYGRSVHYPPKEMDRFLEHHCSYLTELTLRCSKLTDNRYEAISQCQGLTSLQLYSCVQLTSKGVSHLTNLMKLRRLHLTGMRMVRVNSLLDFIQRLPRQIKELNLSYSWFGDEHCSALSARLPNLRFLELWRTRVSAFRLVQLIKLLTSLEDLDTDAIFVDGHIKAFSGHRSLKNIRCRWIGQIKTRFHIKSAIETVPAQYLREDEEGPRGGLFYYWLQDLSIRTASNSPVAPAVLGPYIVRKSSDYDLYDRPLYDGFPKFELSKKRPGPQS